jgi:hypothetical protein
LVQTEICRSRCPGGQSRLTGPGLNPSGSRAIGDAIPMEVQERPIQRRKRVEGEYSEYFPLEARHCCRDNPAIGRNGGFLTPPCSGGSGQTEGQIFSGFPRLIGPVRVGANILGISRGRGTALLYGDRIHGLDAAGPTFRRRACRRSSHTTEPGLPRPRKRLPDGGRRSATESARLNR